MAKEVTFQYGCVHATPYVCVVCQQFLILRDYLERRHSVGEN